MLGGVRAVAALLALLGAGAHASVIGACNRESLPVLALQQRLPLPPAGQREHTGGRSTRPWPTHACVPCSFVRPSVCWPTRRPAAASVGGAAAVVGWVGVWNGAGVDFGSEFMKVALVQPDVPLEIVPNTISKRKTDIVIGFDRGERQFGARAVAAPRLASPDVR